ncbi:MAG: bifunctional diaminohydroxyphosphoribosylaminopyrimidine deaminase/5-amino-6-(5-phosphoribosylamino)uracil reductase RibD [Bacteroidota bacterium]|nr:bifunctional diaminohydroxyphosphoribosylaminopyrimidine deaminase/5-amino-6-(5-phosphoribosylamino)uracil reductase RibD [Bacteroidota bacterium]
MTANLQFSDEWGMASGLNLWLREWVIFEQNSLLTIDEQYMQRCLQLAKLGAGHVAPNPMVGAVLVYEGRIIGEGYHREYGKAHAEVNCIDSAILDGQEALIHQSTLYVSLEPCAHFGKTPPCVDLIIRHKIPKVVVGCRDPFKEVNGRGIEKLRASGAGVITGVLEKDCKELNKRFFTFHIQHRPYIILKWAETADGFIAAPLNPPGGGTFGDPANKRLLISNEYTNRLVHKWRSEETAILIGTNTVINDDPELTTRWWPGNSPARLVVDMHLRLPSFAKVFDRKVRTIVFNSIKHEEDEKLMYYQVTEEVSLVHQIVNALYQLKIQSVFVEGGARLLQSFIDEGMWDEARKISNRQLAIGNGLPAPQLIDNFKSEEINILFDKTEIFKHSKPHTPIS